MNGLELRDIHLPDASLWWPPAPGWWLLFGAVVLAALVGRTIIRARRRRPLRRRALQELARIRDSFAAEGDERAALAALATLLRRALISRHGRAACAASTGAEWCEQLRRETGVEAFNEAQLELLAWQRYRRDYACDMQPLFDASERWLRGLPQRSRHAAD